MDPLTLITITSAAVNLLKETVPVINDMVKRGEISVEDQQKLLADINSLRNRSNGEFSGPEWEQSNRKE